MPSLPVVSGDKVARALRKAGFERLRQVGSHATFDNPTTGARVVINVGTKDLRPGTLRAIIRQAGMTVAEFVDHL